LSVVRSVLHTTSSLFQEHGCRNEWNYEVEPIKGVERKGFGFFLLAQVCKGWQGESEVQQILTRKRTQILFLK
jgi:hypothetical protein